MRHIIPYVDNSQSFGISQLDYTQLIINEADILNRAESMIPKNILWELEVNLLLEKGFKEVDKYHRNLIKGKNTLIKGMSSFKISKAEMNKIDESFKSIIKELKSSKINEDESIAIDPNKAKDAIGDADWNNVMANIENTTDLPASSGEESKGILGMLQNLLNTLTEGGSPIGILHFILDIVGLVGDLFGPVGMIADIINGLIYMFRAINGDSSKWILALISFAAAAIPFAGNIMKGMFQTGKAGKDVVKISTQYMESEAVIAKGGKDVITGSAHVSSEAVDLLAKAGPESAEALKYVAKASQKSLPLVKQMLDKFFKDFLGTIVGWVPFIGTPLKKFFASIADMFDIFFKKSTKFADDVPKIIKEAHVKEIDEFFKATASKNGTKIIRDGNKLIVKDSGGAILKELDASVLKSVDFLKDRYGPDLANSIGKKYMTRTEGNVLNFYEALGNNLKVVESSYGKVFKMGVKAFKFSKNLTWFIGKQVAKFVMGFDIKNMTDGELELLGATSINQAMKDRRDRALAENPKAGYAVPILDSIEDPTVTTLLNDELQKNAEHFALPDIGMAAYALNRRKDNIPQDVLNFWNGVYDDKEKEVNELEKSLNPPKNKKSANEIMYANESLKYIRKFTL